MQIYVISWYAPESCGGFYWFKEGTPFSDVYPLMVKEAKFWGTYSGATIRLVKTHIPERYAHNSQAITDYLDSELIDDIEHNLPACASVRIK